MKNPETKTSKKAVVLDTSAFLAGFDPFSISEEQYTIPLVKEEITRHSMLGVRMKTALESGKLRLRAPGKAFVDAVKDSANISGDRFFLSETDFQLIALALELKANGFSAVIATDDYAIQNVANQLNIEFVSLATFGIRFRVQWLRYCPACHRNYPADHRFTKCEVCGTELKRKPIRKSNINL
jgi:UPF0271 protein